MARALLWANSEGCSVSAYRTFKIICPGISSRFQFCSRWIESSRKVRTMRGGTADAEGGIGTCDYDDFVLDSPILNLSA